MSFSSSNNNKNGDYQIVNSYIAFFALINGLSESIVSFSWIFTVDHWHDNNQMLRVKHFRVHQWNLHIVITVVLYIMTCVYRLLLIGVGTIWTLWTRQYAFQWHNRYFISGRYESCGVDRSFTRCCIHRRSYNNSCYCKFL